MSSLKKVYAMAKRENVKIEIEDAQTVKPKSGGGWEDKYLLSNTAKYALKIEDQPVIGCRTLWHAEEYILDYAWGFR